MGKAVLHFEKHGEPTSGSLGHHIDREQGKEYSYRHADLTKTHLNQSFQVNDYCAMGYNEAIRQRVKDGYTGNKAIRKDATYSVNTILSGSHEEMIEIFSDEKKKNEWIKKNFQWCCEQFGKENIVRFTLHLDEKTPHIHCVFVPITRDGRLSAKSFIGSSKTLEQLQTSYANEMASFGLKRGVKSDRKHQTTEEYRRKEAQEVENLEEVHQKIDQISKTNLLFGLNELKKDLKTAVNKVFGEEKKRNFDKEQEILGKFYHFEQEVKEFYNEFEPIKKKYIPNDEIEEIVNQSNLIDYFLYLASRGHLVFESRSGKEFIFVDEKNTQKISVSEKGWHDLKSGEGGQIIKAIQKHQKFDWLEAVNWLKNFNQGESVEFTKTRLKTTLKRENLDENTCAVTQVISPSSLKLINYFKDRGISKETLKKYAKQVHYQVGDKHYYGIGIQNQKGGYEIRNPFVKMKLGSSDVSELGNPKAKKMMVCEGMTDIFSMIEILKDWGRNLEDYKFVCLNSVTNVEKFINHYSTDTETAVFLCLDGDEAGNTATKKIRENLANCQDVRENFGIHEKGYKDLNEHLQKHQQQKLEYGERKSRGMKR